MGATLQKGVNTVPRFLEQTAVQEARTNTIPTPCSMYTTPRILSFKLVNSKLS